jgi:hypothetical protein
VATFRINSIVPILIFFLLILATASAISQMLVEVETQAQGTAEFSRHRNFSLQGRMNLVEVLQKDFRN